MILKKKRGYRVDLKWRSAYPDNHDDFMVLLEVKNGNLEIIDIIPDYNVWEDDDEEEEWKHFIRAWIRSGRCIEHPEGDHMISIEEVLDLPDFDWRWGYDR